MFNCRQEAAAERLLDDRAAPGAFWRPRDTRLGVLRRVRQLRPRRMLEIGRGERTFLPGPAGCEEYWAADLPAVLRDARVWDVLGTRVPGALDTVVLDWALPRPSDFDRLVALLHRAWTLLMPGGVLFVVGVPGGATPADPDFFVRLKGSLGEVGVVDIRLADAAGEPTGSGYEVALHKAPAVAMPLSGVPVLRWGKEIVALSALPVLLTARRPVRLRMVGLPNERTAIMSDTRPRELVDPRDVRDIGTRAGYDVITSWSNSAVGGRFERFDALLVRRDGGDSTVLVELYHGAARLGRAEEGA